MTERNLTKKNTTNNNLSTKTLKNKTCAQLSLNVLDFQHSDNVSGLKLKAFK